MSIPINLSALQRQLTSPVIDGQYPSTLRPTLFKSGTVAHGSPLTVTCSGFSFDSKVSNTPAIWETFAAHTPGNALSVADPTWVNYNGHGGGIASSANPRYTGSKSAYNDWSRHEFATSYKKFPFASTVYCSFYVRVDAVLLHDYGVIKHTRLNSDTTLNGGGGGGGVYNGVGSHSVSNHNPRTSSNAQVLDPTGNTGGGWVDIPLNQWNKMEYHLKLSTPDVADGLFGCAMNNGATEFTLNGLTNRTSAQPYQNDTLFLGLMMANAWTWHYIQVQNIFDNTVYSVTIGGNTRSVNSGVGATNLSIITALAAAVNAGGNFAQVENGEIEVRFSNNSGVAVGVYDSNFTKRPYSVQITDAYLEVHNEARLEIGNAPTRSACTILEPQPYTAWATNSVTITQNHAAIAGQKYLFYVNSSGVASRGFAI